jgi:hypothetical protein
VSPASRSTSSTSGEDGQRPHVGVPLVAGGGRACHRHLALPLLRQVRMANDLTWVFRWSLEAVVRVTGISLYLFYVR